MGVSVRVSRNTRISLPFWLGIPLLVLSAMLQLAVIIVIAIVRLGMLAVQGIVALTHRSPS